MNRRWSIVAFSALAVCANAAQAQRAGNLELTILPQYSWMFGERQIDDAIGIGGGLGLFLSNKFKLTASGAYHPSKYAGDGTDITVVPLRFGAAYEFGAKTRFVPGLHVSYISSPNAELNDVGVGLSAALKIALSQKLSFITQLTGDVEPAWFNKRTYHVDELPNPPITLHHTPDGYVALGAGLSLRLGRDGGTPAVVVIAQPPPASAPAPATKASDATPSNPTPQPQPAPQPVPTLKPGEIVELQPIYFDYDRSVLREDAVALLARVVEILQANPNSIVMIEGHADERGTDAYNQWLGQKRAAMTLEYLMKQGLPTSRLQTVSRGEKQPADPNRSEQAYAHNRRVEFKVQSGGPLRAVSK